MHVLGQLMTLSHLDGTKVTTEEASQAAQLVTASQLPLTSLLERACSSSTVAPSLSLLPLAEQLHCSIRKQPQPPMSTKEWTSKVIVFLFCFLLHLMTSLTYIVSLIHYDLFRLQVCHYVVSVFVSFLALITYQISSGSLSQTILSQLLRYIIQLLLFDLLYTSVLICTVGFDLMFKTGRVDN